MAQQQQQQQHIESSEGRYISLFGLPSCDAYICYIVTIVWFQRRQLWCHGVCDWPWNHARLRFSRYERLSVRYFSRYERLTARCVFSRYERLSGRYFSRYESLSVRCFQGMRVWRVWGIFKVLEFRCEVFSRYESVSKINYEKCVSVSVFVSLYVAVPMSVYVCLFMSLSLSVSLSLCQCLRLCLSVSVSLCLCLSVCLSVLCENFHV